MKFQKKIIKRGPDNGGETVCRQKSFRWMKLCQVFCAESLRGPFRKKRTTFKTERFLTRGYENTREPNC
jgi:hypothetical protein